MYQAGELSTWEQSVSVCKAKAFKQNPTKVQRTVKTLKGLARRPSQTAMPSGAGYCHNFSFFDTSVWIRITTFFSCNIASFRFSIVLMALVFLFLFSFLLFFFSHHTLVRPPRGNLARGCG